MRTRRQAMLLRKTIVVGAIFYNPLFYDLWLNDAATIRL